MFDVPETLSEFHKGGMSAYPALKSAWINKLHCFESHERRGMILVIPIFSNTFLLIRHTQMGTCCQITFSAITLSKCSKHQWLPFCYLFCPSFAKDINSSDATLLRKAVLSPSEGYIE